jgi:hypothetical protein
MKTSAIQTFYMAVMQKHSQIQMDEYGFGFYRPLIRKAFPILTADPLVQEGRSNQPFNSG